MSYITTKHLFQQQILNEGDIVNYKNHQGIVRNKHYDAYNFQHG